MAGLAAGRLVLPDVLVAEQAEIRHTAGELGTPGRARQSLLRYAAAITDRRGGAVIPSLAFGRTGHRSSRIVFGAAALWNASPEQSAQTLEQLLARGVNHIDVANGYGPAELRVGESMPRLRQRFFLATKTGKRDHAGAWRHVERSLERLQTDRIDLIQLHNLSDEPGWQLAFSEDGALRALCEAREQGLVRIHRRHGPRHGGGVAAPAQPRPLPVRLRARAVQPGDDEPAAVRGGLRGALRASASGRGVAIQRQGGRGAPLAASGEPRRTTPASTR